MKFRKVVQNFLKISQKFSKSLIFHKIFAKISLFFQQIIINSYFFIIIYIDCKS